LFVARRVGSVGSHAPSLDVQRRPVAVVGDVSPGRDGRGEVVVLGRLDVANRAAFLRIVHSVVAGGARTVVVDLSGAELDPDGIATLAIAQSRLRRASGEIVLKAPRPTTLRLLHEARLVDRFTVR
jgi:anti-anti-sigma regulatory factor